MLRATDNKPTRGDRHAERRRDWEQRGVVGPVEILTRHEAARIGRDFREQYARSGNLSTRNRHVDLPALSALCVDSRIWEAAHDILGNELLLWRTNMFLDNPSLPWHEDRHAGLFVQEATFSLSMLLALEESPPDNCTVFVPGSHALTVPEKEDEYGIEAQYKRFGNIRYRGMVPAVFHEPMPLEAGEAVVFHPELLHASSGYVSDQGSPSSERLSCTFRVTTPGVEVRDEAFPEGPGSKDHGLQVVRRPMRAPR